MSAVIWKLEYNGQVRPLAQWGIESASLDFGNQVLDTLTLTLAEDAETDPQFAFEKKIVLFRDDGEDNVRWFTGWVMTLPTTGSAGGDRQQYQIAGPWYWLDKIIFQQPAWVLADPNAPQLAHAQIYTGKLALFQSTTGGKRDAGAMAQDVVDWAIFKATQYNAGVALFARGTFTDVVADAPWEKGLDLSCSEALRRCLRWVRDAVAWWDYSAEIPVLNVKRRASLTVAEIDLAAGDRVEEFSVTPREDLVPRGVILRFQQTVTIQDATSAYNGSQWIKYTEQTAGTADGGPRCISATLTLAGTGAGAEPIPDGLAAAYYDSLATKQWEGSITLREADPTGILRVGNVLNILHGKSTEWETMAAVIQRVTEDIGARKVVAEFGPADQLSSQDFLDQVRFQKEGSVGSSGGTGKSGFDGQPEGPTPPPGAPPAPPSGPPSPGGQRGNFITVCDPDTKQEKTIFV